MAQRRGTSSNGRSGGQRLTSTSPLGASTRSSVRFSAHTDRPGTTTSSSTPGHNETGRSEHQSNLAWQIHRNKKSGVPVDCVASNDSRTLSLPEEDFPMPSSVIKRLRKNATYKQYARRNTRPWHRIRPMQHDPIASNSMTVTLGHYAELKKEVSLNVARRKSSSSQDLSLTGAISSVHHETSLNRKQRQSVQSLFNSSSRLSKADTIDLAFTSDSYSFKKRIMPTQEVLSTILSKRKSMSEQYRHQEDKDEDQNMWSLKPEFLASRESSRQSSRSSRSRTAQSIQRQGDEGGIKQQSDVYLRDPNSNPVAWSHARSLLDLWEICLKDEHYMQIGIRQAEDEGAAPSGSGTSSGGGSSAVGTASAAQLNDTPNASLNVRVDSVPGSSTANKRTKSSEPQVEVRTRGPQSNIVSTVADHRFKLAMTAVELDDESGAGLRIARALGADEDLFQGAIAARTSIKAENEGKRPEQKSRDLKSRSGVKLTNKPKTPDYQKYHSEVGESRPQTSKVNRRKVLRSMRQQQNVRHLKHKLLAEIKETSRNYWKKYIERTTLRHKKSSIEAETFFENLFGQNWENQEDEEQLRRKGILLKDELTFVVSVSYSHETKSLNEMVHQAEKLIHQNWRKREEIHPVSNIKVEWYTVDSPWMELIVDEKRLLTRIHLSEDEPPLETKCRLGRILQAKYLLLDHNIRLYTLLLLHRLIEKRVYSFVKRLREKIEKWAEAKGVTPTKFQSYVESSIRTQVHKIVSPVNLECMLETIFARAALVATALYKGLSLSKALSSGIEDVTNTSLQGQNENQNDELGIFHVWAYANIDDELYAVEELTKQASFQAYSDKLVKQSSDKLKETTEDENFSPSSSENFGKLQRIHRHSSSSLLTRSALTRTPKRKIEQAVDKPWKKTNHQTPSHFQCKHAAVLRNTRSTCTLQSAGKLDKKASQFLKNLNVSKHLLKNKDEETVKNATDIAAAWFHSLRPQASKVLSKGYDRSQSKSKEAVAPVHDERKGFSAGFPSKSSMDSITSESKSEAGLPRIIPRQRWWVESPYVSSCNEPSQKEKGKTGILSAPDEDPAVKSQPVDAPKLSKKLRTSVASFDTTLSKASSTLQRGVLTGDSVSFPKMERRPISGGDTRRTAETTFNEALNEWKRESTRHELPEESEDEESEVASSAETETVYEESPPQRSESIASFPSFESVEEMEEPVEISTSASSKPKDHKQRAQTAPHQESSSLEESMAASRTRISQQLADVVSKVSVPPQVFNKLLSTIKNDMGMEEDSELMADGEGLPTESTSSSLKSMQTVMQWKEFVWAVRACIYIITAFDMAIEETGKLMENFQEYSATRQAHTLLDLTTTSEPPSDLLPLGLIGELQSRGLVDDNDVPLTLLPPNSEVMTILRAPIRIEGHDEFIEKLSSENAFSKSKQDDFLSSQTEQSSQEAKIDHIFRTAADALSKLKDHRHEIDVRCHQVKLQRQWFEIEAFLKDLAKNLLDYATSKYHGISEIVGEKNVNEIREQDTGRRCKDILDHLSSLLEARNYKHTVYLSDTGQLLSRRAVMQTTGEEDEDEDNEEQEHSPTE